MAGKPLSVIVGCREAIQSKAVCFCGSFEVPRTQPALRKTSPAFRDAQDECGIGENSPRHIIAPRQGGGERRPIEFGVGQRAALVPSDAAILLSGPEYAAARRSLVTGACDICCLALIGTVFK